MVKIKKIYIIMFETPYHAGTVHDVFDDEGEANKECFRLNENRNMTRFRVDPWNLKEKQND
jgi:hypothetical protein